MQVKASHILVESEKEAQDIQKQLEGGADFEVIAKEKSKCPSGHEGGNLGWFGKNMMVKPFEQATFNLKDGEISGPVQTEFGWHIIKKTGEK